MVDQVRASSAKGPDPVDKNGIPLKYQIDEDTLQRLYQWVDDIPLSRPKKNITRDFSDGVLMAEVAHHFAKRLVELHNYSAANSYVQKLYNWDTLNQKVFKRIKLNLSRPDIERICQCVPGAIEWILIEFQKAVDAYNHAQKSRELSSPLGSPQNFPGGPSPQQYGFYPMGTPAQMGYPTPFAGIPPAGQSMAPADPNAQLYAQPPAVYQQQPAYGLPQQQPQPQQQMAMAPQQMQQPQPQQQLGAQPGMGGMMMPQGSATPGTRQLQGEVDAELLVEKEAAIQELRDTVDILEKKIGKLEQLVKLKDSRIQVLTAKLQQAGLS
eukprot:GAFH01002476.1.p1 GENE.GAFH01002476.1~~GAFH01002476.1.p1  ORF type:complete len:335 (-),score=59.26 GAFH01002476.1:160-1131(-)